MPENKSSGSGFDTASGQIIVRREQMKRDRAQQNAEAAEDQLNKLIKGALKDEEQKQSLSKECLERYQGKRGNQKLDDKPGNSQLPGRNEACFGQLEEGEITGFEKLPWQDDE